MTDLMTGKILNCHQFRRLLYHFQANELPEVDSRGMEQHLDACPGCARRMEVEDAFLTGIKARLRRVPAPPGLQTRVREALKTEAPRSTIAGWLRLPWLVPAVASVLLALVLVPSLARFSGPPWTMPAGVIHVDREVTVVDVACDRAGFDLSHQRFCENPDHLNALKVGPGQYWSISLDQPTGLDLAVDHEMRGHRLHIEGDFYTGIRTVHLSGFSDLGLAGPDPGALPAVATRVP